MVGNSVQDVQDMHAAELASLGRFAGGVSVLAVVLTARDVFAGTVASLICVHCTVVNEVQVWPPYIGRNRTAICRAFLASRHDMLVMVDADMQFGPDALATLVHAADMTHGIVGGLYTSTRRGGSEVFLEAWRADADGHLTALTDPPAGCDAVDAVGAGLMVIPRRVLEAMSDPWFPDGSDEDLRFCLAARALGITVFVHGGVPVGHARTLPFFPGGAR